MSQQPLASVAPGLYRMLCTMSESAEKEEFRTLLQAPYFMQSEHIVFCAFGNLREVLAHMYHDAGLMDDHYNQLCGEANRLYGQRLGFC